MGTRYKRARRCLFDDRKRYRIYTENANSGGVKLALAVRCIKGEPLFSSQANNTSNKPREDKSKNNSNTSNSNTIEKTKDENIKKPENTDTEEIYATVEQMPVYPGGELEMKRHIRSNVNYPTEARENGIQGTVYLRVVVLETGEVGKVKLMRGVHPLLDKEAIRVVKSLKKFKPGQQQGGKKSKSMV